jgi:hypothetical protein
VPISLLTALKVIPWGDVITAAPGIVKGARKMFARAQDEVPVPPAPVTGDPLQQAQQRIQQLEEGLARLHTQQQAAAQLLESLAEQNAQVVQVIEILRARSRLLGWTTGVLAVVCVATLVLSYGGFGAR